HRDRARADKWRYEDGADSSTARADPAGEPRLSRQSAFAAACGRVHRQRSFGLIEADDEEAVGPERRGRREDRDPVPEESAEGGQAGWCTVERGRIVTIVADVRRDEDVVRCGVDMREIAREAIEIHHTRGAACGVVDD